ncbi:ABC-type Fe3+/spermidine/putrescine transport system ATPase subunit [Jejuia pallidilutea]|uniref:ABC-type Fe3+/spermidine/putrescine transport system ATPase subunit n=1 Tax=Jejuia pallidilutea TaxID=504487 RepID=A0A362X7Y5_9FLAO|nr:ABC transporter ATP-binding protein [Jejuia pallidilutea]PQV49517.1 ABC-type Fe3+/spermidine/putrescine transport system ATPase subunit [Jejuia pallidilutea]
MLNISHLSFSYGKTKVLKDISFEVKQGENVAIIGESGSGKSTLLKLLYGEYDLNDGQIFWKDTEILGPKYNLVVGYDFMKYVAQEFDLMPFITVEENIAKHLSRFFPEEAQQRVDELIKVVQLEAFAKRKVKTLSGGQKQRVALARALVKAPEILLLDEPFGHIDNFKKQSLRRSVFKYLKDKNITCIVATHDKEDVLGFADRMIVLHDNTIVANAQPKELFENPESPLIAAFFGEFNVLNNTIYYAHQLKIVLKKTNLKGIVKNTYFNGANWLIEVNCNNKHLFIHHNEKIESGEIVFIAFS